MPQKVSAEAVEGHWVHSHEEDTPTEMVFRPAGFAFPPSRGRHGFELKPDGSYLETGIGPADKPRHAQGRWRLEDNKIAIHTGSESGAGRVLEVTAAAPNRLVVRK
jgi:hypothetical protein